jgi:hypothetical protein
LASFGNLLGQCRSTGVVAAVAVVVVALPETFEFPLQRQRRFVRLSFLPRRKMIDEFSFSSFSSFCCSSIGLLQRHGIDLPEVL